jgi:hypothetical protein
MIRYHQSPPSYFLSKYSLYSSSLLFSKLIISVLSVLSTINEVLEVLGSLIVSTNLNGNPPDEVLGERFLGERLAGERLFGERFLGERGERFFGERLFGERFLGERLFGIFYNRENIIKNYFILWTRA